MSSRGPKCSGLCCYPLGHRASSSQLKGQSMLCSEASILKQPTNKTNKPKQQQKDQSKNVFLNVYSRLKMLSSFCFKNRSCGGLIAKVCIFYSTAFEQYKIPGLFLRSKFVPTHQYKRISKAANIDHIHGSRVASNTDVAIILLFKESI